MATDSDPEADMGSAGHRPEQDPPRQSQPLIAPSEGSRIGGIGKAGMTGRQLEADGDELGTGCDDAGSKGDKEFRRRRLTFARQDKKSSNVSPLEVPAMAIYRALELGEEDAGQVAPFPASVLGIYSCHGAEPGWDEGEEDLAKINQDRACVVHPYLGSLTCALVCVYDGHGERGDMVSNFAMNEIPTRLAKHPKIDDDPEIALQETFEEVDRALEDVATGDEQVFSGTTAVVALYRDGRVWVANAGDSRAVLGAIENPGPSNGNSGAEDSAGVVAVALSHDHNPDRPGELERIEACGGFVSPPPEEGLSARVWLDRGMTQIGLAMARSIGDRAVKNAGVVATPEIMIRSLAESDAFMVLASDGVWEFMGNDEVVGLVQNFLKRGGGNEAAEACAEVISVAAGRWRQFEGAYRDDISCVVLRLPCFPGAGTSSSERAGLESVAEGSGHVAGKDSASAIG